MKRRDFIKSGATAVIAASALQSQAHAAGKEAGNPVRIGVVGVGSRGTGLLQILLDIEGVQIPAICDIDADHLARAQTIVTDKGRPRPEGYSRGPWDFKRMAERNDLDAVLTATPWEWHTPVMVAAMKAGKYGATEVPACVTIDECWELVETSEQTGKPCMMLENVNYFRNVMMVLTMIRQNLFGELLHFEAGYQHDVRFVKFDQNGNLLWRGKHSVTRNGNLYPTHPIGPIAWWADINRGDRFEYLVSMSTKSRGLNHEITKKFGPNHPNAKMNFALGDINTTLIRTHNGLTVTLYHDTQSPRPYDLIFRVQGTEGIYSGTLDKIYIDGRSPKEHTWEDIDAYAEEFEHPMWKKLGPVAKNYGHGGGDYMEIHQFVKAVRNKTQTPEDVYDAATWSVISPLTEQSIANKSKPVDFPDFTKGKWMTNQPIGIVEA
ncbi:Gfo/Idh/MocA family oxidoreductase [bacterium]|nr:Gfo/Idh/MocA family oxidoreductase [bacterium]